MTANIELSPVDAHQVIEILQNGEVKTGITYELITTLKRVHGDDAFAVLPRFFDQIFPDEETLKEVMTQLLPYFDENYSH